MDIQRVTQENWQGVRREFVDEYDGFEYPAVICDPPSPTAADGNPVDYTDIMVQGKVFRFTQKVIAELMPLDGEERLPWQLRRLLQEGEAGG
jgi:hypothetical protein